MVINNSNPFGTGCPILRASVVWSPCLYRERRVHAVIQRATKLTATGYKYPFSAATTGVSYYYCNAYGEGSNIISHAVFRLTAI